MQAITRLTESPFMMTTSSSEAAPTSSAVKALPGWSQVAAGSVPWKWVKTPLLFQI